MKSTHLRSITPVATTLGLVFGASAHGDNEFMLFPQMHIPQRTAYSGAVEGIKSSYTLLKNDSLSPSEIVVWLKDEGLPIALIAEITFVERKSVYAWLQGGAIRSHNQERLEKIYSLLNENKMARLKNLYRYWSRIIPNQRSLASMFQDKALDETAIRNVLSYLWPLAEKEQNREVSRQLSSEQITSNSFLRESREVTTSYES